MNNLSNNSSVAREIYETMNAIQDQLHSEDYIKQKKTGPDGRPIITQGPDGKFRTELTDQIDWRTFDSVMKNMQTSWTSSLSGLEQDLKSANKAGTVSIAEFVAINGLMNAIQAKVNKEAVRIRHKEPQTPRIAPPNLDALEKCKQQATADIIPYVTEVFRKSAVAIQQLKDARAEDPKRKELEQRVSIAKLKSAVLSDVIKKVTHLSYKQIHDLQAMYSQLDFPSSEHDEHLKNKEIALTELTAETAHQVIKDGKTGNNIDKFGPASAALQSGIQEHVVAYYQEKEEIEAGFTTQFEKSLKVKEDELPQNDTKVEMAAKWFKSNVADKFQNLFKPDAPVPAAAKELKLEDFEG